MIRINGWDVIQDAKDVETYHTENGLDDVCKPVCYPSSYPVLARVIWKWGKDKTVVEYFDINKVTDMMYALESLIEEAT